MKKLCCVLLCAAALLPSACCARAPWEPAPLSLTAEQAGRLEEKFNAVCEKAGFSWGDTPRLIPNLFAGNEDFRFKAGFDPKTKQKGLHLDLASEEFGKFRIGDYQFGNNFCSVFYGISAGELEAYEALIDAGLLKRYKRHGTDWYIGTMLFEDKLGVDLMYLPDADTMCCITVDLPGKTKLTGALARQIMDDFLCVPF